MAETAIQAKVAVGCDMFYMAKNLSNTAEGATYGTPFNVPINAITNDSAEEKATYYFDNHKNDIVVSGNADEELALVSSFIPLETLAPIIGQVYENGAMLVGAKESALYACMWRTKLSDGKHRYHCAMLVDFTRPSNNANTEEGTNANMLELTGTVKFTVKEWAITGGKKSFMYTQMDEGALEGVDLDSEWFKAVPTPDVIKGFVREKEIQEFTAGAEVEVRGISGVVTTNSVVHMTVTNASSATVYDQDLTLQAIPSEPRVIGASYTESEGKMISTMFNTNAGGEEYVEKSMLFYPMGVTGYKVKLTITY